MVKHLLTILTFSVLLLRGADSMAAAVGVDAIPFQGVKVRIDGVLAEWRGQQNPLGKTIRGTRREGDADVYGLVGFDRDNLFFAFKVIDSELVRTPAAGPSEDHAVVQLAFPKPGGGYSTREIALYPGKPGKVAGVVKSGGKVVKGALLVEAPLPSGYKIEARVPWSAFAEAQRIRVGVRVGLRFVDVDAGGSSSLIMASSDALSPAALPPLLFESERSLQLNLLRAHGLPEQPARVAYGDVAGDEMFEQVAVYGAFLTIVGPRYRSGNEFYYAELGISSARNVQRLELLDFDHDGRDEIVVQKRIGSAERYRELLQVLSVQHDGTPSPIFQHEIAIKTRTGLIQNRVTLQRGADGPSIQIAQDKVQGIDPDEYKEPLAGGMPSAFLPWDRVKTRTFKWRRDELGMWTEEKGKPKMAAPNAAAAAPTPAGPAAPAPSPGSEPAPPRPPSATEMQERLYALYRRDRGVGKAKPRFDFMTDVAEDATPERVLLHGKDLVVFGRGFLGGQSYSMISVGVDVPGDIQDAGAKDLTGDGKAEIILRTVLRAKASRALGGDVVNRFAVFVYTVDAGRLSRIFAAETTRQLGQNKIVGEVNFERSGRGYRIELRPGKAYGWSEKTYPFPADTTSAGGLEPLLLPWGSAEPRRYRYSGGRFELQ